MEETTQADANILLLNKDLRIASTLIEQLDTAIQHTGNLELSKTLNEIFESYQSIRNMLNKQHQ